MDAVLLALGSSFLFGSMAVLLRIALSRGASAEAGAFLTIVPAFGLVLLVVALRGAWDVAGLWPFLFAGVLGPGLSQLFFTLGVRDAGASRTSVTVGTAPLFSIAIALVLLDETIVAAVLVGALLIVAGGVLLIAEPVRPAGFMTIGLVYALVATIVIATRDNLVRWLSLDTEVDPALAAAASLLAGGLTVLGFVLARRSELHLRDLGPYLPAGLAFGLSYLFLFEAYYRGPVTVVSPLVATESLWGVGLSALVLGRRELVGPRLAVGAVLVVSGGVLIGLFR